MHSMNSHLVLGRKPVLELLERDRTDIDLVLIKKPVPKGLHRVLERCKQRKVRYKLVPESELDRLGTTHQGVAARMQVQPSADPDRIIAEANEASFPVILVLDQVQDPGNLGTLARTMSALGGAGIILPKDRSAPLGPGAMKASAGSLSRIGTARVTNLARTLDRMLEQNLHIYGAVMNEGESVLETNFRFPAALVLGGEEKGIRPNVLKRCTHRIHIPMPGGLDSLNVAQAGALILGQMLGNKVKGES